MASRPWMPETDLAGMNFGRLGAEDIDTTKWASTGWKTRGTLSVTATQATAAAQPTVSTRNGKPCVVFDGQQQFLNLSTDNLPTGDFTILVVGYMNSVGGGQWRRLLSYGGGSDNNSAVQVLRRGQDNKVCEFTLGAGTTDWSAVDVIVVVTKQGTTGKLWVNDVLVATGTFASVMSKTAAYIGRGQQYADFWPGGGQQFGFGDQCATDAQVHKITAWASYYAGQNGGNVANDNPDKNAAPTVTTGGAAYALTAAPGAFQIAGAAAGRALRRFASVGVLAITGRPASQALGRTASSGAFALLGGASTASKGTPAPSTYTLPAATGQVTVTGRPAAMAHVFLLACGSGAYQSTGRGSSLSLVRSAATGAVALTGRASAKAIGRPGLGGSLAITGRDAARGLARAATPGALALTGPPASRALSLAAPPGALRPITGRSTTLATARFAAPGSFALAGPATGLRSARILVAGPGVLAVTGTDAGYTYSHVGSYVLGATTGQYTIGLYGDGGTKHLPFSKRKRVRFGLTP